MKYSTLIYLSLFTFFLSSCDEVEKQLTSDTDVKLPSIGRDGEIYVIMDTALWSGEVGTALRETFERPIKGLLNEEPFFILNNIDPLKITGIIQRHHNIIYVSVFNQKTKASRRMEELFSDDALKQINEKPELFYYEPKETRAKNQRVIHLFSNSANSLKEKIAANSDKLFESFIVSEKKWTLEDAYTKGVNKDAINAVKDKFGIKLRIPATFLEARNKSNFYWVRDKGAVVDRSIFISSFKYWDESQFSIPVLMDYRDSILANNIWGSGEEGDTSSYMLTEPLVPLSKLITSVNNKYAVRLIGSWRLANYARGGPFVAFAILDEKSQQVFYIESFVYASGEKKREHIRELEAILGNLSFIERRLP